MPTSEKLAEVKVTQTMMKTHGFSDPRMRPKLIPQKTCHQGNGSLHCEGLISENEQVGVSG